jgi:thiamine pyrophosphate-dependent acetolactate synthase large subunit-like protein
MNVNDAVAHILKLENVEWVACYPSNQLIESVAREGIRPVMFRQERAAVMAADGYSRLNRRERFGVIISQGAAGSENAMGGIAQAFSDNIPILYLPGGDAGLKLDQYAVRPNFSPVRTYQSVSKYGEVIVQADQVADVMRRAFHHLRNGRPGPVIVEIPADVGTHEVPEQQLHYRCPQRSRHLPDGGDIRNAVKLLLDAKRPMIWSGMGVLLSAATEELKTLAELTGIPVYTTTSGKSSFDERHPLALGAGSRATTLAARTWLDKSDVLFAVGSSMTQSIYNQSFPSEKIIIHNTESSDDMNKDFAVDCGIPGDARLTLQAMIEEVKTQIGPAGRQDHKSVVDEIAQLRTRWMAEWTDILNSNEIPINTYRVIGELERHLDKENSIVTHDAGAPRDTIVPFYRATTPHSYIGWGKSTHLGYGIPLMIGAKLARPEKFCLNFMGDGAFGMSGLDLETSVRIGAPITTIVLNNGGMATYPKGYVTARKQFNVTHMTGDYAKIAEGLGAVGITVTRPDEVAPAIKQAQQLNAEGETVLLDIHTNLEARRSRFD